MNIDLPLITVLFSVALAAGGWIVVHSLASARDQNNKRRELRVQHLMSDYLKLENCIQRHPKELGKDLESVVASIQLFGTATQI
jgi:hypothetical protein